MKIFHLDCSINSFADSLTRQHSRMVVERLIKKSPDPHLYYLDLVKAQVPFIDKDYQVAMFKSQNYRSEKDKQALESFNLTPFLEADVYVFGVPGYLFNVPAVFKNWMEHLFRIDSTVSDKWIGLLKNKKMYVVSAWGGIYTDTRIEGTYENSIRSSFRIFGIEDITFFNIFNDRETNINNISQIREAIEHTI